MSRTFSIACTQCRKSLWVAQGLGYPKPENLIFYSGAEPILALEQFLLEHFQHPLVFDDNCEGEIEDYEDVTPGAED
jgi:hypothetical protein